MDYPALYSPHLQHVHAHRRHFFLLHLALIFFSNPASIFLSLPYLPPFSADTYVHLRVKLLGRWAWIVCPGYVIFPEVVSAVFCVPFIITAGPGQSAAERGVEVEQSPGDDGVIVEGHIQCNDADGETNTWQGRGKWCQCFVNEISQSNIVFLASFSISFSFRFFLFYIHPDFKDLMQKITLWDRIRWH